MSWLVAVFLAIQGCILSLVNSVVRDDYMDEIFHGPQAREYCRGAFTAWHPKITTFPGIYYLGTLYGWARWAAHALVSPLQADAACGTPFLRSLNVLLSAACLIVIRDILLAYRDQTSATSSEPHAIVAGAGASGSPMGQRREPGTGPASKPGAAAGPTASAAAAVGPSTHALLLALYPLHWFFSFLYYTDVASLLFLLLAQLQVARRRYRLAAFAGALAVLCRQTNAVWAAFLLGEAALAEVGMDWAAHLRRRLPGPVAAAAATAQASGGLVSELQIAVGRLWQRRTTLAARMWPLLLPPAGFVAFLMANDGSVVLGDKEAHKPVRHGAQLLYFGSWVALMLWPQLWPVLGALCRAAARRPLIAAAVAVTVVAATAAIGHVSTMVHPYMLADNRHYVFYLWRRLLGRRDVRTKALLAPAYAVAWALLMAGLLRRVSWLWLGGFMACLAATLLPAWLLELRYFTPGFFLIALRLEPPSWRQAAAMLSMYGTINVVTLYLFLFRPYEFADGSVARFIW